MWALFDVAPEKLKSFLIKHRTAGKVKKMTNAIPEYLNTHDAAKALMRQEATLRRWAFTKRGPVQPVRINRRLAWPVDQIVAVLNGEVQQ